MKLLTRRELVVEEQGQTYIGDNDGDSDEAHALKRPDRSARSPFRRPVAQGRGYRLRQGLAGPRQGAQ